MKAVTAEQMREIEQRSVDAGVSLDSLMENAGLAVANEVAARIDRVFGSFVTVLVGPGNNGSDGLVAARHLALRGSKVTVFALTRRPEQDEKRELAEAAGVKFVPHSEHGFDAARIREAAANSDIVVDAVLGTGQARPIEEPLAGMFRSVREVARSVVAIDLPTGMNANTGRIDENGLRADVTLMLGFPKFGPLVTAGEGACGEIQVLDIGVPDGLADSVATEWVMKDFANDLLPERPGDANKGSFGRVLIVGGSRNYLGAPLLATRAAIRSGAGLVYLATAEPVYNLVAGQVQEAIYLPLPVSEDGVFDVRTACADVLNAAKGMDSLLIGPGLGQSPDTIQFVEQLVRNLPETLPVVLDADALNTVSRMPGWAEHSGAVKLQVVLTPHPGEMARLLRTTVSEVQQDRAAAATEAAKRFNATVVLKGAATLIATPDGAVRISPWVNSGLAKGGTGDVLAGLLAGLLAQMPNAAFDAASLAVFVHGLAGDIAHKNIGERGMTAGDVADAVPAAFVSLEG